VFEGEPINELLVGAGVDTARSGQEIDSFQQAGFTLGVVATQQNWARRKLDGQAAVITIIGEGELANVHNLSINVKHKT
jgi:hypothetical protein